MKATLKGMFAVLLAAVASSSCYAQFCPSCQMTQYMPSQYTSGPYMASPYSASPAFYGMPYGGGYGYMPPQPFGGVQPPGDIYGRCSGCQKIMAFPVHRYARSPRDYFMVDIDCCGTH
jgi:hypothetical protein